MLQCVSVSWTCLLVLITAHLLDIPVESTNNILVTTAFGEYKSQDNSECPVSAWPKQHPHTANINSLTNRTKHIFDCCESMLTHP